MKDPMDCTYPQERLCPHECCEGCIRKKSVTRLRVTRRELEDAQAEDEAFQRLTQICDQLGVCQSLADPCPNCPRFPV